LPPDREPLEWAAIEYCAPRGIPLSRFLGALVYPGEPEWTDDDRLAALEWQAAQSRRCVCGENLDESLSPDNEQAYRAVGVRCHACAAIASAAAEMAGHDKRDPLAGMRWRFQEAS
jgi:hypothetical protein